MKDLTIAYDIISNIWRLFKYFEGKRLTDDQWQQFIDNGYKLQAKYREQGEAYEVFFRCLFAGIQEYYEYLKE